MDCRDILIRQVDNAGVLIRLGDTCICTDIRWERAGYLQSICPRAGRMGRAFGRF
ncbi:hypothetical protein [[Clostridium] scindens]|uniref:hypothetical protein n=1 Tax=Clostridium scindens (strain JCM 10418 / VPI 12708) TaxID=29347 RepID=UPI00157FB2CD|nr:hypothetical protein [[Clostridium] scindens]MBS5694738.1 hypothetical protein [Lachnospiraceae bacterium]MCI6396308.1 hypothetical protein [[Clostridium] scindens]MDY4868519.1 hypothetical protein [[Clostridium] scindens]MEE0647336.1 hypothetical protein [[Clostridium] scindens]QRO35740.1 hypothetical protein I6J57_10625 [[Clostridium] scindens]